MFFGYENVATMGWNEHSYSCVYIKGSKVVDSEEYSTRNSANQHMYDLIDKNNETIKKVYDDHHDKTYICENGDEFHINRIY